MTKQLGTGTFSAKAQAEMLSLTGEVPALIASAMTRGYGEEVTEEDVVFNGNNCQDALEALEADRFEEDLVAEAVKAAGVKDLSYLPDFEALVLLLEVIIGRNA
tara:strand:+ start:386 stop:697 length:312 start_codon:yes stop_codon:yes gene_type:complete